MFKFFAKRKQLELNEKLKKAENEAYEEEMQRRLLVEVSNANLEPFCTLPKLNDIIYIWNDSFNYVRKGIVIAFKPGNSKSYGRKIVYKLYNNVVKTSWTHDCAFDGSDNTSITCRIAKRPSKDELIIDRSKAILIPGGSVPKRKEKFDDNESE